MRAKKTTIQAINTSLGVEEEFSEDSDGFSPSKEMRKVDRKELWRWLRDVKNHEFQIPKIENEELAPFRQVLVDIKDTFLFHKELIEDSLSLLNQELLQRPTYKQTMEHILINVPVLTNAVKVERRN